MSKILSMCLRSEEVAVCVVGCRSGKKNTKMILLDPPTRNFGEKEHQNQCLNIECRRYTLIIYP